MGTVMNRLKYHLYFWHGPVWFLCLLNVFGSVGLIVAGVVLNNALAVLSNVAWLGLSVWGAEHFARGWDRG